jgi:cytosine permease
MNNYELEKVPKKDRRNWLTMFSVLIAIGVDLSSIMLGKEISSGMSMESAIFSVIIGSFIVAILCTVCALVGSGTHLSTAMITKYVFGKKGAKIFSLVIGLSLLGWFGVQVGFFAQNAQTILLDMFNINISTGILSLIGGILMMTTAVFGYRAIEKLSVLSVPFLLAIILFTLYQAVTKYTYSNSLVENTMSSASATSLVISIFIVGATTTPDISRWAKSKMDAIISTFFGILIGNSFMIVIAIVLTSYMNNSDIMKIFIILGLGIPGILTLTLAQWTTNTTNLYSASLGISLIFSKMSKRNLTIILGLIATSLAVFGIYDNFITFLNILAIIIAPIGGIYSAEYFVIKEKFKMIEENKEANSIVIRSMIAWVIGILITYLTTGNQQGAYITLTGIPPLDGFIAGFIVQVIISFVFKSIKSEKIDKHKVNGKAV